MDNKSKEIDNLVSQFASSANTLQQAYLSLENELLDTFLPDSQVESENESLISDNSIWEFRKNLIHVLDMLEHPVLVINENLEIITKNNPAKVIYQFPENETSSKIIFTDESLKLISDFLQSGIESKNESLSIKIPIKDSVKFELRRHIDNFTKSPLASVACVDDRLLQSRQVQGKIQMQNMMDLKNILNIIKLLLWHLVWQKILLLQYQMLIFQVNLVLLIQWTLFMDTLKTL